MGKVHAEVRTGPAVAWRNVRETNVTDLVAALTVKAAKEYRANGDGGVTAEGGEEATALEGNVASTDDACLAR